MLHAGTDHQVTGDGLSPVLLSPTTGSSWQPTRLVTAPLPSTGREWREGRGGGYNVFLHFLKNLCSTYVPGTCTFLVRTLADMSFELCRGEKSELLIRKVMVTSQSKAWVKVICVLWKNLLKWYGFFLLFIQMISTT